MKLLNAFRVWVIRTLIAILRALLSRLETPGPTCTITPGFPVRKPLT